MVLWWCFYVCVFVCKYVHVYVCSVYGQNARPMLLSPLLPPPPPKSPWYIEGGPTTVRTSIQEELERVLHPLLVPESTSFISSGMYTQGDS